MRTARGLAAPSGADPLSVLPAADRLAEAQVAERTAAVPAAAVAPQDSRQALRADPSSPWSQILSFTARVPPRSPAYPSTAATPRVRTIKALYQ